MFEYKKGNSFLHKLPVSLKLFLIPLFSVLFLFLNICFSITLIIIQFLLAFIVRLSIKEQFSDFKPILFYIVFLIFGQAFHFFYYKNFSFENQKETIFLLIKFFCIIQSSSIIFRTTSTLEIYRLFYSTENKIRKIFHLKENSPFTDTFFIFLNFIPLMTKIWTDVKRAWIARNGKKSIKMYFVLIPILFSVGLKKAYNTSRAILIRK